MIIFLTTSCQKEEFTRSGMVHDHFFLQSGGQNMPATVAGNIASGKLLLIVHGGPGGNALAYRNNYIKTNVESEFAVVYWYQRVAGNSQGNNGDLNISAFSDDLKKLIQLLKHAYGPDKKIYLFAHSWGGFLAPYFLIGTGNEALVDGWMQIGGAHDYAMNDSLTHEMLLKHGMYHHPTFHDNYFAQVEWNLRRQRNKGLYYEFAPGAGISRTFLNGATYNVNHSGEVSKVPMAGNFFALLSVSGSMGYNFSLTGNLPGKIFVKPGLMFLLPYNKLVYTRPTVEVGYIINLRETFDKQTDSAK